MKPHEHGGQIKRWREEFGISSEENIYDFSANINPLGIPDSVKEVIEKEIDNLPNYPEPEALGLCRELATAHNVFLENVLAGNGASELIDLFFLYLKPKKLLQIAPTFSEYERAGISAGSKVENFYLGEKSLKENLEDFLLEIENNSPDVIAVCSPNNPTGELLDESHIDKIFRTARKVGGWLLIDKSFISFTREGWESLEWEIIPEKVVLLYSFTKMFALAGLRLGYMLAPRQMVEELKNLRNPWSVNHLAQTAGMACLLEKSYEKRTRELVRNERERMIEKLLDMGLKPLRGEANYLLVKINEDIFKEGEVDSEFIWGELGKKGIFIRRAENFAGLDKRFFRIAVKLPEENDVLLAGLRDVLAKRL